jgi:hypothetical protein
MDVISSLKYTNFRPLSYLSKETEGARISIYGEGHTSLTSPWSLLSKEHCTILAATIFGHHFLILAYIFLNTEN